MYGRPISYIVKPVLIARVRTIVNLTLLYQSFGERIAEVRRPAHCNGKPTTRTRDLDTLTLNAGLLPRLGTVPDLEMDSPTPPAAGLTFSERWACHMVQSTTRLALHINSQIARNYSVHQTLTTASTYATLTEYNRYPRQCLFVCYQYIVMHSMPCRWSDIMPTAPYPTRSLSCPWPNRAALPR